MDLMSSKMTNKGQSYSELTRSKLRCDHWTAQIRMRDHKNPGAMRIMHRDFTIEPSMCVPFAAALLTALVLSVTLVVSPLIAQESREAAGTYNDWSVHRVQDGDLRVCYAETKLVPSREAENRLGDVRLQVTSRSISGSSDMIRITSTSVFSDKDILLKIDSFAIEVNSLTELDFDHTRVVNQMRAEEASRGKIVLLSKSDRSSIGVFSLRGFSDAYSSVEQLCPEPEALHADPQSISVSNISVVERFLLVSEFTVTGPFFHRQKSDRIKIRAVLPEASLYHGPFYTGSSEIDPLDAFIYGSQQLEFYHDGALIDVVKGGLVTNRITGACLDPETGRLKIVLQSWDGGFSDPGDASVVYFDSNRRVVKESVHWYGGQVPMLLCSEGESSWQWGGQFLPCQCIGRAVKNAHSTTMDDVVRELNRFSSEHDSARTRIDSDSLSSLLSEISRLKPVTQWDATASLEVERFESSKFAVAVITYTNHAHVYEGVQTTLVRQRADDSWQLMYFKEGARRGFNPLKIHGFVDEETLDISKCVAWCDSWDGTYERVTENIAEKMKFE